MNQVRSAATVDTVIFDVDGTLVDSNYQHALAWYRAMRRYDVTVPVWKIHRAIGMGGDQLVSAVAGDDIEDKYGDEMRAAWTELFDPVMPEIVPFPDATPLLRDIKAGGFTLILASSGQKTQVEHYLELLGARDLADTWTTSDDAEASKPAPDLVSVAMEKADGGRAVMIGDSTWDVIAAAKVGIATFAVRTGGFGKDELLAAGAINVYDSLADLQADLASVVTPTEAPPPAAG